MGDVPNNKFGEIFVRVRDDKSPNPARRLQGDPNGNNLILPPIHFNKNRVELSHFPVQQIIASFNALPPILKAEYDRVRFAEGLVDHFFSVGDYADCDRPNGCFSCR